MFEQLEQILISLSNYVPLEIFAPVASVVEEIIAPIPSPAVMIVTGSLAALQEKTIYYLVFLALLGSLGKLLGSLFVYFVSDKVEDYFSGILEKFFGVTHEDIESFGKKLNGGYRDYLVMFLMRALPIIPSSVVSIGGGILKIPLKLFIVSTFLGSIVRDFIYIYFGYSGISILGGFLKKSESLESWIQLAVLAFVFGLFTWLYLRRRKQAA
ncbi:MAG: VTT domain-containing protein [Minisyncoccia bacterium]